MAPVPLGLLPRKTGSRLGGRHLRPLRGGLGRDPVPPLVPSQWGSGNRATVSPRWFDSLWCGPAVPHCARPSGGLLKRCSCSRRELQELKSQNPQGVWAGGRTGQRCVPAGPSEWSEGRTRRGGEGQGLLAPWRPYGPPWGGRGTLPAAAFWAAAALGDRARWGLMGLGKLTHQRPWVKNLRFLMRGAGGNSGGLTGLVGRA